MSKHTGDGQPTADEQPKDEAAKFTKQQFLGSSKYADQRDVLSALLQDGKTYTTENVDQLLTDFLKKEAK